MQLIVIRLFILIKVTHIFDLFFFSFSFLNQAVTFLVVTYAIFIKYDNIQTDYKIETDDVNDADALNVVEIINVVDVVDAVDAIDAENIAEKILSKVA